MRKKLMCRRLSNNRLYTLSIITNNITLIVLFRSKPLFSNITQDLVTQPFKLFIVSQHNFHYPPHLVYLFYHVQHILAQKVNNSLFLFIVTEHLPLSSQYLVIYRVLPPIISKDIFCYYITFLDSFNHYTQLHPISCKYYATYVF